MKKVENAAAMPYGYLLSEDGREQLTMLRDQLFLIAGFVFANTLEEEQELLEIRRSMLGQLLESFGLRIDEVLGMMKWGSRSMAGSSP
jgi:hypothetical protein